MPELAALIRTDGEVARRTGEIAKQALARIASEAPEPWRTIAREAIDDLIATYEEFTHA